MSGRAFLDSNVLLYALAEDDPREGAAARLLAAGGTISAQALNESSAVARRKLGLSWPEVEQALSAIRALCPPPLPTTIGTHEAALGIAGRLGYRFHDGLIIASALEADCAALFSEDMEDRQVVEGRLTIRNPFRP